MKLSRRGVLAGAAVGGGLVVAWSLLPREFDSPIAPGIGETAFDAWLKIASDGVVTVAVPQLEMGQGVTTLLPQIVAMELGADWRQMAVEPAPISGAYANFPLAAEWAPLWKPTIPSLADDPDDLLLRRWAEGENFTATADGTTLAAYEMPCRIAAASARTMLAQAAADRWDVPWEEIDTQGGFVRHDGKALTFAELALEAAAFDPPDPPPLRPEAPFEPAPELLEEQLNGRVVPFPRLDLPSKVDGSFQFAGDVRLPDMVYAGIRHGRLNEAEVSYIDVEAAAGSRDLISVIRGKRWVAAVAANWWAAEQALDRLNPRFGIEKPVRSATIAQALDDAVREGEGQIIEQRGEGVDGYDPGIALRYDIGPGVHATPETASATARLADGKLELWIASQAPEAARRAAARALGMSLADVILYPMPAGGSFDRRLEHDHAIQVALIAREAGRPVQLIWSRWQELLQAPPRPPAAILMAAQIAPTGQPARLRARLAGPSGGLEFGRRLFGNSTSFSAIEEVAGQTDASMVQGLMPAYGIPDVAVEHVPVRINLPAGRMRGKADGYTCFAMESFMDELARKAQAEPLSFRIAMLGGDIRLAECLQRAARLAQWNGGEQGSGQGLACHRMGTADKAARIAVIATAMAGAGGVRVRRLTAAVDIGRVVNRDIALQQIEGGMIFGLGLALGSSTEYDDGLPTHQRLSALGLPTLEDCPEMEIELIESDAPPVDPGEIGVPAVAPAIANALFSATGLRLRRLPLLSGGL